MKCADFVNFLIFNLKLNSKTTCHGFDLESKIHSFFKRSNYSLKEDSL